MQDEPGPAPERTGQYFAPRPDVASRPSSVRLDLPDVHLDLATDRGVFSGDRVDAGTKLLLLEGPRPDADEHRPLLDLGCGYGPIAVTLARRAPGAEVWAVDVNERALDLCRGNAERAGVGERVHACSPTDVPAGLVFAGMWSNPPIRIGKAALHELLLAWLPRLLPGAGAHLVVQRHLGADSLARWLQEEGWSVDRLRSRQAYRLLEVRAA